MAVDSPILGHSSAISIRCWRGFTLLELVITLLLIGILSAMVAPRFFGRSDISPLAARTHLQRLLSQAQLYAMYGNGQEGRVLIASHQFGLANASGELPASDPELAQWLDRGWMSEVDPTLTLAPAPFSLSFDRFGRPLGCTSPCTITLSSAGGSIWLTIEDEGFIHGD